jgi:hypothetical protein
MSCIEGSGFVASVLCLLVRLSRIKLRRVPKHLLALLCLLNSVPDQIIRRDIDPNLRHHISEQNQSASRVGTSRPNSDTKCDRFGCTANTKLAVRTPLSIWVGTFWSGLAILTDFSLFFLTEIAHIYWKT